MADVCWVFDWGKLRTVYHYRIIRVKLFGHLLADILPYFNLFPVWNLKPPYLNLYSARNIYIFLELKYLIFNLTRYLKLWKMLEPSLLILTPRMTSLASLSSYHQQSIPTQPSVCSGSDKSFIDNFAENSAQLVKTESPNIVCTVLPSHWRCNKTLPIAFKVFSFGKFHNKYNY